MANAKARLAEVVPDEMGIQKKSMTAAPYQVEEGWIVGHNLPRYNNRPLYLHQSNAFILTGDKPIIRMAKDSHLYGTLCFTLKHQGGEIPFDKFSDIKSCYQAGKMRWELSDSSMPGMHISIDLLPLATDTGCVVNVRANGMKRGNVIEWYYGGAKHIGGNASWTYDALGHPDILSWGVDDDFLPSQQGSFKGNGSYVLAAKMNSQFGLTLSAGKKEHLAAAKQADRLFHERLRISTPCPALDAMANASLNAVDGTWRAPVFVHGCMQWNSRFPGWRTIFGGTMYGWHERVFDEAKFYIDAQIRESDKTSFDADPAYLYTKPGENSRFYGVGRIDKDQAFYDMQSQFFDQLIEEYRWINDPQLIALLREALELHIQWITDCFDPDGDGLFESYINLWPTDSQWYNGGGTAEETSYAYRAHRAARDMAWNAADTLGVIRHQREMEKIKHAFQNLLWINGKGHSGAYIEQGGYRRVHQDPWLYSIFLPIDAELTDGYQALESLYYPEWALQNDTIDDDGRMVWTSNWVPGTWSVREKWPGDNYHLAQMYFNSGLPEQGWQIMRGTFMQTGYYSEVPGNLGGKQGGIDFGDCVHTFARCLVEGLFGYHPDYPRGEVLIAPSFPKGWDKASLALPDYQLDYRDDGKMLRCKVRLAKAARTTLRIPIHARRIYQVRANGKPAEYTVQPYPDATAVCVTIDHTQLADVEIRYEADSTSDTVVQLEATEGYTQSLTFPDASVYRVDDPQHILSDFSIDAGCAQLRFAKATGHHSLFALVRKGELPQLKIVRVRFGDTDTLSTQQRVASHDIKSYHWHPVDIQTAMNADVRTIFQQQYLEPRPKTISVRIGVDGFSPWTFPYWGSTPPAIQLDKVETMKTADTLTVPQGITFYIKEEDRNIAFTSLWENFPDEIAFPMQGVQGDAISFLVCGSTNMMQCHIENAVIEVCYSDGHRDLLRLVPPMNYWNLCPIDGHASAPGQDSRAYYTAEADRFCMPAELPQHVVLGQNCTAMLLTVRLRENLPIEKVILRCMSQEVVVGLMGISIGEKVQ